MMRELSSARVKKSCESPTPPVHRADVHSLLAAHRYRITVIKRYTYDYWAKNGSLSLYDPMQLDSIINKIIAHPLLSNSFRAHLYQI